MNQHKSISIVAPLFNEEKVLPLFRSRLEAVLKSLPHSYEIIVVNDGSTDGTAAVAERWVRENPCVVLLNLSRNFGHQQAITAGIEESSGDAVIIIDDDLQDPPEKIPAMVQKWEQGAQIVLAERKSRKEFWFKRIFFVVFYKMFRYLSDSSAVVSSGVFSLMSREVVNEFLRMEERNRYLPGLRGWLGFKTERIYYDRADRIQGKARQSFGRLFQYGMNAIFSFSHKPLHVSLFFGLFISTACVGYAVALVVKRLLAIDVVHGFTTPTVAILFLGSLILISNGIIGSYLARIYDEVKRRPLFIVASKKKQGDKDSRVF